MLVLAKALPATCGFWRAVDKAVEAAKVPTAEAIRDRQAKYRGRSNTRSNTRGEPT